MPHNQLPNYIRAGPWDSIGKKNARELTIINTYRHFFNKQIPSDKQYWSMCGAHFDVNGKPLLGELGFLLKRGLISKDQYFGVDREASIINKNRELFPDINWIEGDFLDSMETHLYNENFNPAIINYDGIMQPKFGSRYLKQILKFVDYNISNKLLLLSTFILTNPYSGAEKLTFTIQDAMKEIASIYWIPDHWTVIPQAYVYSGMTSKVGVIIFIKDKHDLNNITFTKNRKIK